MCSLNVSVRVVAFLSLLLSIAVVGTGAWLLQTTYEARESTSGQLLQIVSNAGVWDKDKDARIKLGCSATAVAAGALQLLTSLFLLFCASSKSGKTSGKLWLFINFFVILAVAGSFICFASQEHYRNEWKNDDRLKFFLLATGLDAIFLFIFMFVTGAFSCRSS
jgi:Na+/melibiose symporter-like transporter